MKAGPRTGWRQGDFTDNYIILFWYLVQPGFMLFKISTSLKLLFTCHTACEPALKSISTSAQYVTLDNKIKCLSLTFIFGQPDQYNTVIGTAWTWELLLTNPLDQIIMIDQSEILSRSQDQFITLFFRRCLTVLSLLPNMASCTNLVQRNRFPELKRHILIFSQ